MVALKVSDDLGRMIQDEAKTRGLSVEEYLKPMVQREKTMAARQKIEQEQKWWLGQPLSERARYEGEYVAVHSQVLVDHDKDEAKLYQRIRSRYGNTPVLIMPAEGPQEIHIFSPRISH